MLSLLHRNSVSTKRARSQGGLLGSNDPPMENQIPKFFFENSKLTKLVECFKEQSPMYVNEAIFIS